MGLFGRGYDDEYDRGFRGRGEFAQGYRRTPGAWPAYGAEWTRRGNRGSAYDNPYSARYDVGYGYRGYDRGYKSRWQTDHGDPFGDRVQQTPIRVVREHPHDRHPGLFARSSYGRDYEHRKYEQGGYPFGYIPYDERAGYDTGYRRRLGAWRGRNYDDYRF